MERWGQKLSDMEMKSITVGKSLRTLHYNKKQSNKEVLDGHFFSPMNVY